MSEPIFLPHPFWFASDELLAGVWGNEVNAVIQLLKKHPDFRALFDDAGAIVPQRKACFRLLAHLKLKEIIDESFVRRYVDSPSLGDEESEVLSGTMTLVKDEAPAWVLEVNRFVERLPWHISAALPEPLRVEGFYPDNSRQVETINAAALTLSSVDQIQALTSGVIEQQLRRLERRWTTDDVHVRKANDMEGSKRRLKGTGGLGPKKLDLSRYMDKLTEKQRLAFSLKYEYGLGLSQIASRMEINRKTADEHIKLALKKVNRAYSNEKHKVSRRKKTPWL